MPDSCNHPRSSETFSFDVFDTVLVREVAEPAAVFELLGDELRTRQLWLGTRGEFRTGRIEAEQIAESRLRRHPSLSEIYRLGARAWADRLANADIAMVLEVELEAKLLHGIPESRNLIEKSLREGRRVMFTSDMYLLPAVIVRLLINAGVPADLESVLVSNAAGFGKRDGRLFRLLQQKAAGSRITHIGNSVEADIRPAQRLGLHTLHWEAGNLNFRERRILQGSGVGRLGGEILAGASRWARLSQEYHGIEQERKVAEIAASVGAPVLALFAIWLLREAKNRSVARLYFLSRDGWAIKLFVDAMAGAIGSTIETRYLYASRQAWASAVADGDSRALTRGYLQQEGLLEPVEWGIVDLGWNGNMQRSLLRILPETKKWTGFYFGLTPAAGRDLPSEHLVAFAFDHRRAHIWDKLDGWTGSEVQVMESFCSVAHGSVTKYRCDGESFLPVFRPNDEGLVEGWGIRRIHHCYAEFAKVISKHAQHLCEEARAPEVLAVALLRGFVKRPTKSESVAWGRFPFEHEQGGEPGYRLAEPILISFSKLWLTVTKGVIPVRRTPCWVEGCWRLTSVSQRFLLGSFLGLGLFLRSLRFLIKRVFRPIAR